MSSNLTITNVTKDVEEKKAITGKELGVINSGVFFNFLNGTTINVNPVSYRELKRMTDQDGQARALLNILTMPLRTAKWDVYDNEEDEEISKSGKKVQSLGNKTSKERDFIHEVLFRPPQEGGMSIPFDRIIGRMSYAVRDGFKVFEKVFKLDDKGRIVYKKLAPRDNDTVRMRLDANGDFNGFNQQASFAGRFVNVDIPKEKALLYTFGDEENTVYGNPLFLPVYYHFDKKHKLYFISHIAYQMLAVPPRVTTIPSGTGEDIRKQHISNLAQLGFNSVVSMPEGFVVEPFESKRSLTDFMPLIEHHNGLMAKAVLGQFIDLTKSSTGMLAGEQADLFLLGIVSLLNAIENVFNFHCIPQLIDLNFGTKRYPRLRARPFADKDQQNLMAIFQEIMTSSTEKLSPEFLVRLEKKMSELLNINDIDYDTVEDDMLANAKARQEAMQNSMNTGNTGGGDPGGRPAGRSKKTKQGKEGNS